MQTRLHSTFLQGERERNRTRTMFGFICGQAYNPTAWREYHNVRSKSFGSHLGAILARLMTDLSKVFPSTQVSPGGVARLHSRHSNALLPDWRSELLPRSAVAVDAIF